VSFQIALPMEQGNASHTLIREETTVQASKQPRLERAPEPQRKEASLEHQARMSKLFEKYGTAKGASGSGRRDEVDGPDLMRLG